MTATRKQLLRFALYTFTGFIASACTDGRIQRGTISLNPQLTSTGGGLLFRNSFNLDDKALVALQMKMSGGSLFISGTSDAHKGGFIRAEVNANPESPTLTFIASDNSTNFAPLGGWTPQHHASGAIGIDGSYALTSGDFGTSLINIGNLAFPQEIGRFPAPVTNPTGTQQQGNPTIDPTPFVFNAIVPNGNIFYGFTKQDAAYTYGISSSGLTLARKDQYSASGIVCCVTSATMFQNTVFVAFSDSVAIFQIASNGQLVNPTVFRGLQATYVAATADHLYIQHTPTYANNATASAPKGIYVFDSTGQQSGFFVANTFINFAVAPDNLHLFGNRDNSSVEIYSIQQ